MSGERRHHHRMCVDDFELHWVELGHGDGADAPPPVVLLHGLNDSHRTWKHIDEALAKDRRVLMPDLPGHGLSGRPDASYTLAWYAHVIARWLASLGLERVDVVGHSFGGGIAQMLLLECAERIRRLVLVASGGLGREILVALRLASVPRVVESIGQPFMGLGTRLALRAQGGFTKDDIEELAAMNAKRGSARAFARTVRDIIDWRGQRRGFFDGVPHGAELPPIAVLWGDRDKIIPIAHGMAFAKSLEGVVFVSFEGSGHYLHREHPEAFARALRQFLDARSVPAARLRPRPAPGVDRFRT
jgi:pimeloyl-ACP methyl ester carboxylesterase